MQGSSHVCWLTGAKGISRARKTTQVFHDGFGESWVKPDLPLSILGGLERMLLSSPTWQSGHCSMFLTLV